MSHEPSLPEAVLRSVGRAIALLEQAGGLRMRAEGATPVAGRSLEGVVSSLRAIGEQAARRNKRSRRVAVRRVAARAQVPEVPEERLASSAASPSL